MRRIFLVRSKTLRQYVDLPNRRSHSLQRVLVLPFLSAVSQQALIAALCYSLRFPKVWSCLILSELHSWVLPCLRCHFRLSGTLRHSLLILSPTCGIFVAENQHFLTHCSLATAASFLLFMSEQSFKR